MMTSYAGLLERRACRQEALMALEVEFADGVPITGHVLSFSSGEDFTVNLLRLRFVYKFCQIII